MFIFKRDLKMKNGREKDDTYWTHFSNKNKVNQPYLIRKFEFLNFFLEWMTPTPINSIIVYDDVFISF